jgi:hypothetical protein
MMRCVEVVNAMEVDRQIVSVWQLSTWPRRSPVQASPKVISGEGLIDPRRLRQIIRTRHSRSFSPTEISEMFHFTCQIETNHVILPQSYNRHRASSTAVTDLAASWLLTLFDVPSQMN